MYKAILFTICILTQFVSRTTGTESIAFQLIGNLIVVTATVDEKAGNYIVDTGVSVLILNQNFFQGKETEKEMTGIIASGGITQTRYSHVKLGTHEWKGVYSEITNLEAIERALGMTIHGLIGCHLLGNIR